MHTLLVSKDAAHVEPQLLISEVLHFENVVRARMSIYDDVCEDTSRTSVDDNVCEGCIRRESEARYTTYIVIGMGRVASYSSPKIWPVPSKNLAASAVSSRRGRTGKSVAPKRRVRSFWSRSRRSLIAAWSFDISLKIDST